MTDFREGAEYDAWYRSERGSRIGEAEFRLAKKLLHPIPGDVILDVGTGTGYFARRFDKTGVKVIGLDIRSDWLLYAKRASLSTISWVNGDARFLPFADGSFDSVVSIAALCFVVEENEALLEIVRVAKKRVAVGFLNRQSTLYREKEGHGSYRGAKWHTPEEVRELFLGLPLRDFTLSSTAFFPGSGGADPMMDREMTDHQQTGALLMGSGTVDQSAIKRMR